MQSVFNGIYGDWVMGRYEDGSVSVQARMLDICTVRCKNDNGLSGLHLVDCCFIWTMVSCEKGRLRYKRARTGMVIYKVILWKLIESKTMSNRIVQHRCWNTHEVSMSL